MRQELTIILTVVLVVGVLIGINAATYVGEDQSADSELSPNRSTYHAGATGTRALYDFLSESGNRVMRWREVPEKLLSDEQHNVQTFVVIGDTPLSFDEDQAKSLLLWVEGGGRLVLVDRRPDLRLLPASGDWNIVTEFGGFASLTADPAKPEEMTENVKPVYPVQPTPLTKDIDSVMPSRFAANISFSRTARKKPDGAEETELNQEASEDPEEKYASDPEGTESDGSTPVSPAPVVHLGVASNALLLDYPHGEGRIVVLSDPYIFSNGGISLADNLQLAINILGRNVLTGADGLVAFDEYHQGRGITSNALISYFSGTPVLPILGQVVLLILLVLFTQSRRFARPLPLAQIDRRSSLEFVASMAELQQRSQAFDLALENIYSRTRRVLARYAGMDYNSPRTEIASRVAARSSLEARSLEVLMRRCEEAINGAPVTERQSIQLAKRLREVEAALGLRMRSREAKQATHKI